MLNKILAFAVLSLALLMQPARAETQKSDKEKDSFIQNLSTLNQQQKAQLLDEVVRGVNERYVQLPETDVLQSMRLSHDFPQKEQLTYTIQFQPALRPVLDRNRERFVQIVETDVEQNASCFPGKMVEAMNQLGVHQVRLLFRLENETVWEWVRDLPVCR
ncbi:hypothetical protein [Kingella denitrificans]|uniref:hypothetical protein n=1 Tax=Kingella denitrificans TaxID=502 RepID=UPI0028D63DEB|nr:hypothetical protein [Kingella denitrificans]